MKLKTFITLYSVMLCIFSLGAFYKDEKTIEKATEYLVDCSVKEEEKLKNNEDVFSVIPKDVMYESERKNETTYYTLKTKIKLCFIDEKIINIERCYFSSSF